MLSKLFGIENGNKSVSQTYKLNRNAWIKISFNQKPKIKNRREGNEIFLHAVRFKPVYYGAESEAISPRSRHVSNTNVLVTNCLSLTPLDECLLTSQQFAIFLADFAPRGHCFCTMPSDHQYILFWGCFLSKYHKLSGRFSAQNTLFFFSIGWIARLQIKFSQ